MYGYHHNFYFELFLKKNKDYRIKRLHLLVPLYRDIITYTHFFKHTNRNTENQNSSLISRRNIQNIEVVNIHQG